MKRIFFLILFVLTCQMSSAQINFRYNKLINNYWGNWSSSSGMFENFVMQGHYDEFIIYNRYLHPSNFIVKVKINGLEKLLKSDKKTKKSIMKNLKKTNEWLHYTGTIEFSNNVEINGFIEKFPFQLPTIESSTVRYESVTIKIEPFKDNPKIYNIYFSKNERDGFGISLN